TPPPVVSGDHLPLTVNSWWSYDESNNTDTLKRVNTGVTSLGGNSYNMFVDSDASGPLDTMYFRKANSTDYYEYTELGNYSGVPFDNPQYGEIPILKEGLTTNATWNSAVFSGSVGGTSINLRFVFTC